MSNQRFEFTSLMSGRKIKTFGIKFNSKETIFKQSIYNNNERSKKTLTEERKQFPDDFEFC